MGVIDRADQGQLPLMSTSFEDSAWADVPLEDNINALGPGYPVYERLRVLTAVEELATLVAAARGLEERPDVIRGVARLILAWVDSSQSPRSFLRQFDLPYRLRRLEFLLNRIGQIERQEKPVEAALTKAGVELEGVSFGSNNQAPFDWHELAEAVAPLRRSLTESLRVLTDLRRRIVANQDFRAVISQDLLVDKQLAALLDPNSDGKIMSELLKRVSGPIQQASSIVADAINETADNSIYDVHTALRDGADLAVTPNQKAVFALTAWTYQSYEAYDSIVLPLTFGSSVGEAGKVDVMRISPDDALTLRSNSSRKAFWRSCWRHAESFRRVPRSSLARA